MQHFKNKSLCVLNQKDKLTPDQVTTTTNYVSEKFGKYFAKVVPISARMALESRAHQKDILIHDEYTKVVNEFKKELLEKDVDDFTAIVGRPSSDLFIESEKQIMKKNIFVTNAKVIHKKLSELDLYNTYDLKVTRVFRAGREILPRPSLELFYGDKLRVIGSEDAIEEVEKIIGNSEKKLLEPDFLSLFGGLLLGVILGSIPIVIPSLPVPIKLGFAAGPLIVALLISRYGGIAFIHSYINNGAT